MQLLGRFNENVSTITEEVKHVWNAIQSRQEIALPPGLTQVSEGKWVKHPERGGVMDKAKAVSAARSMPANPTPTRSAQAASAARSAEISRSMQSALADVRADREKKMREIGAQEARKAVAAISGRRSPAEIKRKFESEKRRLNTLHREIKSELYASRWRS